MESWEKVITEIEGRSVPVQPAKPGNDGRALRAGLAIIAALIIALGIGVELGFGWALIAFGALFLGIILFSAPSLPKG